MKVAIIGAGNVGKALARAVSGAGHSVVISAADQESAQNAAQPVGGQAASSNSQAVRDADIVMLAVPFSAVESVAGEIADLAAGKIIVDVTNPLRPDLSGLSVTDRSAAQQLQDRLPSASVVKAFNTVLAGNQDAPVVDDRTLDGYVAGDDQAAKEKVLDLMRTIGYRPLDVGGLAASLSLEHMALLNISLNATNGLPWQSGWTLVGPTD
jgi:NADPH-dependent F420 reductase